MRLLKKSILLVLGILLLSSAAEAQAAPASSGLPRSTVRAVSALINAAGVGSSIWVGDAGSDRSLMAVRSNKLESLASNTKLFTTAAVLRHDGSSVIPREQKILSNSDNMGAQQLYDQVGASYIERYAWYHLDAYVSVGDGSGLDPADKSTSYYVGQLLYNMQSQPNFVGWEAGLPRVGQTGTMADRLGGTAAVGRCQAKTGTLYVRETVSALSGYCNRLHGGKVIFSILMNGPAGGQQIAGWRNLQDRILLSLVNS